MQDRVTDIKNISALIIPSFLRIEKYRKKVPNHFQINKDYILIFFIYRYIIISCDNPFMILNNNNLSTMTI